MSVTGSRRRRDRYVEIDISDYVDLEGVVDEEDCVYLRNCMEDARGCLNRPERSPAEAIMYIERALMALERAVRGPRQH